MHAKHIAMCRKLQIILSLLPLLLPLASCTGVNLQIDVPCPIAA